MNTRYAFNQYIVTHRADIQLGPLLIISNNYGSRNFYKYIPDSKYWTFEIESTARDFGYEE